MNGDEYFNYQVSLFKKTYCHEREVFIKHSKIFTYLYDFLLQDSYAEIIFSDIKWYLSEKHRYVLSIDTWYGDVEFKWKGEKIKVRSLDTLIDGHRRNTFLISCESLAILNELYKDLYLFSIEKRKKEYLNTIFVPQGKDIKFPTITWDDIFLPDKIKEDIKHSVNSFFTSEDQYKKFGLNYKRGFLFTGPPGCGKTMTIKAIVSTQKVFSSAFVPCDSNRVNLYELELIFRYAEEMAPSIVILEDLDKLGNSVPISYILNLLDGLNTLSGILVIATCNEVSKLDSALLLRPSRFDRVWNFPLPAFDERLKLLKKISQNEIDENILVEVAKKSNGFSMAYVQEVFSTALSIATEENRDITGQDLIASVDILRKQIKNTMNTQETIGKISSPLGFNV